MGLHTPEILLVEDCDSDALLIEQAFRKAGVANRLLRARSASAARSLLCPDWPARRPVFVLLDLKLPDLSGYELLKWMRAEETLAGVPVVVVTGSENPEEEARSERAGADGFYRKHLSFEKLVQLVQETGATWSLVTANA
jgi:two-component system response regulator